jgi:hypothetical protein
MASGLPAGIVSTVERTYRLNGEIVRVTRFSMLHGDHVIAMIPSSNASSRRSAALQVPPSVAPSGATWMLVGQNGRLIVNEDEVARVRTIFDLYPWSQLLKRVLSVDAPSFPLDLESGQPIVSFVPGSLSTGHGGVIRPDTAIA